MNIDEINRVLGRRVKILRCEHSDVKVGTIGVVTDVVGEGFGVEVDGSFIVTGANAKRVQSKATVYVERDAIELYEGT